MLDSFTGILTTAVQSGGVLAFAALGGLMAARVGVLNLGLEGLMAIGGVTAIITAASTHDPYLAFGVAMLAGAVLGALFAIATVIVQANQVLCGLALTIMGSGLAAALGRTYAGKPAQAVFAGVEIPLLHELPVLGHAVFSQNILVYLAYLLVPAALHVVYFRTRYGMNLRAVGENPAAADAAGIPIRAIRFLHVVLGSALVAASGAYLTLAFVPSWSDGITAGRGWIGVALVIFAGYRPVPVALGALLFGCVSALSYVGQAQNWTLPAPVLAMLPYLATLSAMLVLARRRSFGGTPGALGQPYFRDQR